MVRSDSYNNEYKEYTCPKCGHSIKYPIIKQPHY